MEQKNEVYPEVAEKDKKKWKYIRKVNAFLIFLVTYMGLRVVLFDDKHLSVGQFLQLFLVYVVVDLILRYIIKKFKMDNVVSHSFFAADEYENKYLQPKKTE